MKICMDEIHILYAESTDFWIVFYMGKGLGSSLFARSCLTFHYFRFNLNNL